MNKRVFEGRTVLVTGAGGSIGSELCRVVMSHNAKKLVLVSLTEAGLYNVTRALHREYAKYRDTELLPLLGDVGNAGFIYEALAGVDVVVHAAAHKHVPICENNPVEAIENNVFGTRTVIEQAERQRVRQFCLVSSDKAVNPESVMGMTKRLAELLVASRRSSTTRFFTVRFGNVMDSAGSVLPLWREQINAGGPLTLTDDRCTRYFMTIEQAVALVVEAIGLNPQSGTFVFDMGEPVNLLNLARQMISKYAGADIEIQRIGLRPGEKLAEELHYGGDLQTTGVDRLFRVCDEPARPLDSKKFSYLLACCQERRHQRARELLRELAGVSEEVAA